MKTFISLLLTCIGVSAATPSFSSFNTNQFSTNNLFISIKDGAVITNLNVITDLFINSTNIVNLFAPASVTNGTTINPTDGYLPYRSNSTTFGDSPFYYTVGVPSTVEMRTTNSQDHAVIIAPQNTNSGTGFFAMRLLDSDGSAIAAQINGFKGTGWGIGSPAQRDGTFSVNVLHDNASNERFEISGDTGLIRFLDRDGMSDIFTVANASGYSGAGTLFLSDDGTYKAAGGVGGDSIWTNITGYVTMVPGQTATNTLSFVSGAPDNGTNILLNVDSANFLGANGSLLAAFRNAGTNAATINWMGGIALGSLTETLWGEIRGFGAIYDPAFGEPDYIDSVFGVYTANTAPKYAEFYVSTNNNDGLQFVLNDATNSVTLFRPEIQSSGSSVAYKFDTSQYLNTSGDLLATFGNAGTNNNVIAWDGGIQIGVNTVNEWGDIGNGETLVSLRDAQFGEPNNNQVKFGVISGSNAESYFDFSVYDAASDGLSLNAVVRSDNRMSFQPAISSSGSSVAYKFDTSNTLTNGDTFVSIGNAGTEVLNISPNSTGAQIVFGPGSTNVLMRSGGFLQITNGATGGDIAGLVIQNGNAVGLTNSFTTGGDPYLKSSSGFIRISSTPVIEANLIPDGLTRSLGTSASSGQWLDLHLSNNISWNGTTNSLFDTWGIATPEGAESARPGSVFRNTAAAGVLSVKTDGTGNTGWQPVHVGNQAYLAANGTVSDATLVNLSLSVGVTSGKKYAFRCVLYCANSTAGDGVKIDFDGGSAAATNFRAHTKITDAALLTSTQISALATDITAATITGDTEIEVNGSFEPSGTGTLIPRFAENSDGGGTLTVYRGSHLILTEIP